ncbi:MAG: helix-turn-helix domain-containing protein [Firmicutes bacterium]|nr:helix-turn-helix domain-containing protein [Bacillota bacterium]
MPKRQKMIELRGEKTRSEVAEDLEITPQMLGALERGDRTPSLALAKKIADYYEVSIDEIFFNKQRNESFPGHTTFFATGTE